MRHLFLVLLAALTTPVGLHGQDRAYDEVPIMAAAVKYMQQFYGEGLPGEMPTPEKYVRTNFRLASATYLIEPVETRVIDGRPMSRNRVPRKAVTQDPILLGQLAAAVGLDTVDVQRAERLCAPYDVPGSLRITDSFATCRFAETQGVFGLSLPVISGDTARVEVWAWVNYPQKHTPEIILEELWEVTIVREAGVWRAVSHRFVNPWRS